MLYGVNEPASNDPYDRALWHAQRSPYITLRHEAEDWTALLELVERRINLALAAGLDLMTGGRV